MPAYNKGDAYCCVPKCTNTHNTLPKRYFFTLPTEKNKRKLWLHEIRRKDAPSPKCVTFVCSDHFDMPNDVENYLAFTMIDTRPNLKKTAVPSKFECQQRFPKVGPKIRTAVQKRNLLGQSSCAILPKLIGAEVTPIATCSGTSCQPADNLQGRTCAPAELKPYAQAENQLFGPAEDQLSDLGEDQLFGPAKDQDQLSDPVEDQLSGPAEDQLSDPVEDQLSGLEENQLFGPAEYQLSGPAENQLFGLSEDQLSGPEEDQPSSNTRNLDIHSLLLCKGPPAENMLANNPVQSNKTFTVVLVGTSATLDKATVTDYCEDKSVNQSSNLTSKCATYTTVEPTTLLPSADLHGTKTSCNQFTVKEKRGRKKQAVHHRSVGTQHKVKFRDTKVSPIKLAAVDAACSPIKKLKLNVCEVYSSETSLTSESETNSCSSSDTEYVPNSSSEFEDSDIDDGTEEKRETSLSALKVTRYQNKNDTLHYLGILKECSFLLHILEDNIVHKGRFLMTSDIVTLVFRKIRRGFTFKTLGDMYGISESYADRIYNMYLPVLSDSLKSFVKMLPCESVQRNLPMAFWARYSNVYIIVDVFEIEIQSPDNPYDQADTYSAYKKCNTVKYLIGISPDGTIMFISNGYVGRDSDQEITIISDFVSKLPRGKAVMSDRGFKNMETLLQQAGCSLVRPPSVKEGEILSADLAKEAKKIASLRSHVERSIGRIREFRMLNIHSAIPGTLLNVVDQAVNVACGLVNCQQPLLQI